MRTENRRSIRIRIAFVATLCCCVSFCANAQRSFFAPADSLDKKRLALVGGSWAAIYGTALVGLNTAWYQQYERTGFHTFNDLPEWNQMDKAGHAWTAYNEARWTSQALRWSGVKPKTADAAAVGTSLLFQTTLEMLDAYSAEWGFSWSDMGANVVGASLFYAQARLWNEQRVAVKFSTHAVDYNRQLRGAYTRDEAQRVDALYGNTFVEKALKDYNGQTYWLSVNPSSFSKKDLKPRWLSVAIGYGAEGMLGGRQNVWTTDGIENNYSSVPRTRQFYLAPDVDFTRIATNSHLLKTVFEIVNVIKFPAPTLMLDNKGALRFYPAYF